VTQRDDQEVEQMPFAWKPVPGQVALIELAGGGNDCLTGVVVGAEDDTSLDDAVVIDLGASPRPDLVDGTGGGTEVVASFFAPDALYRLTATLAPHDADGPAAIIDLRVRDIERVQRRTVPRARISLPVILSNFDDPATDDPGAFASIRGETLDVGEGGCRALMPKPFPSGCDPTITLQLPGGESIVALGAVLQANATGDGHYEYRLVFLELEDVDRLRLVDFVTESAGASA
jgi:hypothetical protein